MLRWRLLLGTVIVAALVGLCWLDYYATYPGVYLAPVALVLTVLATHELLTMMAARDLRPLAGVVYCGNLAIVISSMIASSPEAVRAGVGYFFHYLYPAADMPKFRLEFLTVVSWPMLAALVAFVVCFAGEMRRYEKPGRVTTDLACAAFALLYIGMLFGVLVQLRCMGRATWIGRPIGLWGLLTLIAVVKMGDIGAYTVGRLVGRHKMAPVLSPGKTWEGAAGAIAFSVFGAWLSFDKLGPLLISSVHGSFFPIEPWVWKSYGAIIGAAGLVGDLAESLLKRDLGAKDSSRWMPGFGGVLDILDSILLPAPIAYLLWLGVMYLYF